jgi:hypothetical protein
MDEAPSEDSYRLGEIKRQEANSRKDKLKIFFPLTNKYSGSSGLVVLCDWSHLLSIQGGPGNKAAGVYRLPTAEKWTGVKREPGTLSCFFPRLHDPHLKRMPSQ